MDKFHQDKIKKRQKILKEKDEKRIENLKKKKMKE